VGCSSPHESGLGNLAIEGAIATTARSTRRRDPPRCLVTVACATRRVARRFRWLWVRARLDQDSPACRLGCRFRPQCDHARRPDQVPALGSKRSRLRHGCSRRQAATSRITAREPADRGTHSGVAYTYAPCGVGRTKTVLANSTCVPSTCAETPVGCRAGLRAGTALGLPVSDRNAAHGRSASEIAAALGRARR
jgi:hypothetical protein